MTQKWIFALRHNAIYQCVLFCLLLIALRFFKTHHLSFHFLIWNLFLAWMPYGLMVLTEQLKPRWQQFTLALLSLLFLPNAPYLITDLFHLRKPLSAPLWFDVVLIASFSILGLVLFLAAARRLFLFVGQYVLNKNMLNAFKAMVFVLNAYGVYLGRYLRFNSWDIIYKPLNLLQGIADTVLIYENAKEVATFTLIFSVFLYLMYALFDSVKTNSR